jgi:hypothetical protein
VEKWGTLEFARSEARRITVAFGSMVAMERKRVRKLAAERNEPMPLTTPYEDIMCRSVVRADKSGVDVHFIPSNSDAFKDMYDEPSYSGPIPVQVPEPEPTPPQPQTDLATLSAADLWPELLDTNGEREDNPRG